MIMTVSEQIAGCPDNANAKVVCPKCGESSASAVRQGYLVLWNCKRASCGAKGMETAGGAYSPVSAPVVPQFRPNPCPWSNSPDVAVTELYGFDGDILGRQSRTPNKTCFNWMVLDRTPYCYKYPVDGLEFGFPLWLVEDIASAETLAQHGQPAVALLGTQIKDRFIADELVPWITRNHTPDILIALDADATILSMKQAAYLQQKLAHHSLSAPFLETRVRWVPLVRDIKDMTDENLRRLILEYAKAL